MLDFNEAPEQRQDGIIPDGTFARIKMVFRPGNASLPNCEAMDAGLFKLANPPSDAVMLDSEFIVLAGPHAKRKFWQMMTVAGGSLDEKGVSKAWNFNKSLLRAMVESALGIDPKDMSEAAKAKRSLRGFRDLDGIEFFARIGVERGGEAPNGGRYPDKNRLAHIVVPGEPQYQILVQGGEVAPQPSGTTGGGRAAAAPQTIRPAWGGGNGTGAVSTAGTPAAAAAASQSGPAWLHG